MQGERLSRSAIILALIALTACAAGYSNTNAGAREPSSAQPQPAVEPTQNPSATNAQTPQAAPAGQPTPAAASAVPLLILPVILEYDYTPKYFLQWITDNPQYTLIEASLFQTKPPVYFITLTEKANGRRVFYCNSETLMKALAAEGKNARQTAIEYHVTETVGEQPTHAFSFKDEQGQLIRWQFIMASDPSERGGGVAPGRRKGLSFSCRKLGTAAGEGTTVQIGDKVSTAAPWPEISSPPYFVAFRGAYSIDSEYGSLMRGKESWQVKASPPALKESAQWTLVDEHNNERLLRITARHDDELTISEVSPRQPGASQLILVARETAQGLVLRSISAQSEDHSMRIIFKPELNLLAAPSGQPGSEVTYQIDMSGSAKVSEGTVVTQKEGNQVTLRWQPRSPAWAKTISVVSNITVDPNGYKIDVQ
ncbi:MAG: hypothetical protein V7641_1475 [Blastocatellia bacterium]